MSAERFDAAVRKHRHHLRDLIQSRGLDDPEPSRPVTEGVAQFIAALESGFPPKTGMILYNTETELLEVHALTPAWRAYERVDRGVTHTMQALGRLLRAMGIPAGQRHRLPQRRNLDHVDEEPSRGTPHFERLPEAVADLSECLFPGDVAKLLKLESIKHIVIVPTGRLGTVPYSVLTISDVGTLVDSMSVSVAPSAADVLRRCTVQPTFARPVIVGNPQYGDPDYILPNLPGAEQEAKAIAADLGTEAITGPDATKARIREACQDADLVYLATHGVADEEDPLDSSFIALAHSENCDSRWTAREIQKEWLSAELVVLSACQTGLGGPHDGGVIGLARAFQLAGANQVVMTLWNIDDKESATIAREVMANHMAGRTLPESIRLAMASAKAKGLPPTVWAPFTAFAGQHKLA